MGILDIFGIQKSQPQNASVVNYDISPIPSRGGIVYASGLSVNNKDKNIGELITSLRCGTGGNLVVQGPGGNTWCYLSVAAGQTVYGKIAAVLSSASISGVTVTTTADNITWYGGES